MENVIKVQNGYKVQTLSTYLNQPPPTPPPNKIARESLTSNGTSALDAKSGINAERRPELHKTEPVP